MIDQKSNEAWNLLSDSVVDIVTVINSGYPEHKIADAFNLGVDIPTSASVLDDVRCDVSW